MTIPSDTLDDSSASARKQTQGDASAGAASLPSYMLEPEPSLSSVPEREEEGVQTAQSLSPKEAAAASQNERVFAVAPDGAAVALETEREERAAPPAAEQPLSPSAAPQSPEDGGKASASSPLAAASSASTASPPVKEEAQGKKNSAPSRGPVPRPASFAQTHPILGVEQSMPPSLLSRLYAIPAVCPVLFLSLMLLLQLFLSLDARSLWIDGEVQLAGSFQALSGSKAWFAHLSGITIQPGTPPLYFCFLYGLNLLINTQGPVLFFLASGVCALLYLWAALGLGRFAGRADRRSNLAAGIMLLSTACVLGLTHRAGGDLLFAALTLCASTTLYRAFVSPEAKIPSMVWGFTLAAAAVLTGGLTGLLLPLCAIILFALWRGVNGLSRLFRRDFLIGLASGLVLIVLCFAALHWTRGGFDLSLLTATLEKQFLDGLAQSLRDLPGTWPGALLGLFLALLPWTLLIFFLPWKGLFGKSMREGLAASRTPAKEGLAFLWSLSLVGLPLAILYSGKNSGPLLLLLPPLALLAARAFLGIEGKRAACFRYSLALLLFLVGLAALIGSLMLFGALPKPAFLGIPWVLPSSSGFFAVALILMLTGIVLWLMLGSSRPEGILLITALSATLVGYSIGALSAPALDSVLAPKQQALLLRAYANKEYALASCKVETGIYDYYARHAIPALAGMEEAKRFAEKDRVAIAMPLAEAEAWSDKPEGLKEVQRQALGRQVYVILANPALPDLAPAAEPLSEGFDLVEKAKKLLRELGVPIPVLQESGQGKKSPPAEPQTKEQQAAPSAPVKPELKESGAEEVQAPPLEAPAVPPAPIQEPAQKQTPALQNSPAGPGQSETAPALPAAPSASPQEDRPSAAPQEQDAAPQEHAPPSEPLEPAPETMVPSTAGV